MGTTSKESLRRQCRGVALDFATPLHSLDKVMNIQNEVILHLPDEEQIATASELRDPLYPHLIRKTIRYKNGLVVVLYQDLGGTIFDIYINSADTPFGILNNSVWKMPFRADRIQK